MRILATYFGHESTIVYYNDGEITQIELDKLVGSKWITAAKIPTVALADICLLYTSPSPRDRG